MASGAGCRLFPEQPAPPHVDVIQSSWQRDEEQRLYREWKAGKTKRRREAALLQLCRRCRPALKSALKHLAKKYGEKREEYISPEAWLEKHNLTDEDIQELLVLSVIEAGEHFDPARAKDNNKFSTYTYYFIVGKLHAAASVRDGINHVDAGFDAETYDEHIHTQETGTHKRDKGRRRPIPGGSITLVGEDPTDKRLRFLMELPTDDGGYGRQNSLGRFLDTLNTNELVQLRDWLEENKARAIELYGQHKLAYFIVPFSAFVAQLPPEAQQAPWPGTESQTDLPMQAEALRTDGKRWDLMLPMRAEQLLRSGLSERAVARRLGVPWSTYKDMRKRMKAAGFSSYKVTLDEPLPIVRGKKRGRKPKA